MRRLLLSLLIALFPAPVFAQAVPESREAVTLTFAPVVKKAAPAVVNIYTKSRVQVRENLSPFANDPFFQQFFGPGLQFGGRTREQVVSSLGSGVIIQPDGAIVTSHHVIRGAQEIRVVLSDKREFDAKVTLKDPGSDLAFLKIEAPQPLPSLEMRDSDTLEVGDLVLAIGNPFGVGQTVTGGIISGLARAAAGVSDYQFFIQTDAAINPGNSGGALVDMQGRLIGINTAIYSKSGGSVGIGFAIPANMVRALQGSKVEKGRAVRPWLGFSIQPMTTEIAESMGLKSPKGVLVTKVNPGSSAEKSGLKTGDVIIGIGPADIGDERDLQYRLALTKVGDTANFHILRAGAAQTIGVALTAAPEAPRDQRTLKGSQPLAGVVVANLSPALAVELGIDAIAQEGVVVLDDSKGRLNALAPGDIIREVNKTKITSTAQLERLLQESRRDWAIIYQRGGNLTALTVRM